MDDLDQLDEKDYKILDILQKKGNLSMNKLSKELKLAKSSISLRVKKLKKSGFIKSNVFVLDNKKLGYNIYAFLKIKLSSLQKSVIDEFIKEVHKTPNILECYMTTGDGAFLVKVISKSLEEYHTFVLNRLVNLPAVSDVETSIVIDIAKKTDIVPIELEYNQN